MKQQELEIFHALAAGQNGPNQIGAYLVFEVEHATGPVRYALVADAYGDSPKSSKACQIVTTQMYYALAQQSPIPIGQQLVNAFNIANADLHEAAVQDPALLDARVTVVAAAIVNGNLLLTYVGDNVAYLLRNGIAKPISLNHKHFHTPNAAALPSSLLGMSRNIAVNREIALYDRFDSKDAAPGNYKTTDSLALRPNDSLLICSGEVVNRLTDAEIQAVLCNASPDEFAGQLIDTASDAMGYRGMTAVLIHLRETAMRTAGSSSLVRQLALVAGALLVIGSLTFGLMRPTSAVSRVLSGMPDMVAALTTNSGVRNNVTTVQSPIQLNLSTATNAPTATAASPTGTATFDAVAQVVNTPTASATKEPGIDATSALSAANADDADASAEQQFESMRVEPAQSENEQEELFSNITTTPLATETTSSTPTATHTAPAAVAAALQPTATPATAAGATPSVTETATARVPANSEPTTLPTATEMRGTERAATATSSATATATEDATATDEPSATVAPTATATATASATTQATATNVATQRSTPTTRPTATPRATATPSPTLTVEPTNTQQRVALSTATTTATERPAAAPTATTRPTSRPSATATPTPTERPTSTATPTARPTATSTVTSTVAPTATPTVQPTATARPTATPTVNVEATLVAEVRVVAMALRAPLTAMPTSSSPEIDEPAVTNGADNVDGQPSALASTTPFKLSDIDPMGLLVSALLQMVAPTPLADEAAADLALTATTTPVPEAVAVNSPGTNELTSAGEATGVDAELPVDNLRATQTVEAQNAYNEIIATLTALPRRTGSTPTASPTVDGFELDAGDNDSTGVPSPTPTLPAATFTPTPLVITPPQSAPVSVGAIEPVRPAPGEAGRSFATFEWRATTPLPEGQKYELILWKPEQDPINDGFGLAAPTTATFVQVDLDRLDNTLGALLDEGEYRWGVLLVSENPYRRLRFLGGGTQFFYDTSFSQRRQN